MNGTERLHNEGVGNPPHSKLVLCFDGTGNEYSGNTSDTNIVKLYQKLDGNAENQYHYYQRKIISISISNFLFCWPGVIAGIGTYSAGEKSLNAGLWGRFKRHIAQTIDQAIGTTFDAHVIAGYRFIMRYYDKGDKIYLFGFSRGAFTARFLARMISTIGLLAKGNEEMVPFAYKSYQNYENGIGKFKTAKENEEWMSKFSVTFCRPDVKVHFLGLFDTVNSVGVFDIPFTTKTYLPTVVGTAHHTRHAVAIDERRCKFKAALLQQDIKDSEDRSEDILEVYFPGNHGDVGGGWLAEGKEDGNEANDPVQLSDNSLEWMIREIQKLPTKHPAEALVFNEHLEMFLKNFDSKRVEASTAKLHDTLKFNGGVSAPMVMFWNLLGESVEAFQAWLTTKTRYVYESIILLRIH